MRWIKLNKRLKRDRQELVLCTRHNEANNDVNIVTIAEIFKEIGEIEGENDIKFKVDTETIGSIINELFEEYCDTTEMKKYIDSSRFMVEVDECKNC